MAKRKRAWRARAAKRVKRMFRRKKRVQKRNTRLRTKVSTGLGFPRRLTQTHRYAQTGVIQGGSSGAMVTYNFRCNGMFDPDASGGGHQPMYFDQMTALYDHYTVIGAKITVIFAIAESTPTVTQTRMPITVGVFINDDTTTTPGINGVLENATNSASSFTLNDGSPRRLVKKWSAKKTFGGSILGNSNLTGTATVNPAEEQFFTLFTDSSAVVEAIDVFYRVQIDYIAVWTELKDIAGS